MELGVHAYTWCSRWSNETLEIIDKVKAMDLDFIEIPLMCLETFDSRVVQKRLKDVGLKAVTSTVLLGETDITSDDAGVRRKGVEYLNACVRATAAIEADCFSGVIYSQYLKPATRPPSETHWQYAADCLREVACFANEMGIQLGLEPVSRYESYLLNTCEQALRLIQMIGEKNVKVHLDSYHMNIEEKNFYDATKLAGQNLIHYHLCENDRGIPGTGHVDWDGIFRALAEIGYQGRVGMEGFADCTDNMSTWVWRKLAIDGDTFLQEGIRFIRAKQTEYGLV